MVFGLSMASYDTTLLGLHPCKSFRTYAEAADWLTAEYKKGGVRVSVWNFDKCIILEQLEIQPVADQAAEETSVVSGVQSVATT